MILSFISIDMSYLRIMYSWSDSLEIWTPLGSKSCLSPSMFCFWWAFLSMFLVSFLNSCLPESKFLPRELVRALLPLKLALSPWGPSEDRSWCRSSPGAPVGRTALRLCSGEPRTSHSLAAPGCRLLSAHSACRSRSGGSGRWAGVLERPFTSHKSSSEGPAALCLKRDVFFSPDFRVCLLNAGDTGSMPGWGRAPMPRSR